jgi:hypothetical protein
MPLANIHVAERPYDEIRIAKGVERHPAALMKPSRK